MRLLILSDLHLEFGGYTAPSPKSFDAVILAGDIREGVKAIHWAQRKSVFGGRPVIFVAGNHEYYGSEFLGTRDRMREAARGTNVHFLDRDEVVLQGPEGDRVRFLGATLWTDFALDGPDVQAAMAEARVRLNDFRRIRILEGTRQRQFRPEDALHEHTLSRAWLAEQLAAPTADADLTVVVTHHAPSGASIAEEYQGDELNPCFASDLPSSFFNSARFWVHGHVHNSFSYSLGATRVVANPRGYRYRHGAYENPRFAPGLIIDTKSGGTVDAELPQCTDDAEALSNALRQAAEKLGLTTNIVASAIGVSEQEAMLVLVDHRWLEPDSDAGLRALQLVRLSNLLGFRDGDGDDKRRPERQRPFEGLDSTQIELIQTAEGLDALVDYLEALYSR